MNISELSLLCLDDGVEICSRENYHHRNGSEIIMVSEMGLVGNMINMVSEKL